MKKILLCLIGALLTASAVTAQVSSQAVVSTVSGKVSGTLQEGTLAFLGIPYARVERFMPPLPVAPWKGVRACDQ